MANRTVKDAKSIRGTNPQYLVEKIIRARVYDSKYWKEECFALSAELIVDKAMEVRYIGGIYGGYIKPTPFLCLTLKLLQIQPEKDIVVEFIKNEEFKYVRALGAFYMRLVGTSLDCYKYLEPLFNDNRKLRRQNRQGEFECVHMDEFIDELLREERSCDIILPRIQKRHILEENNEIETKLSALDDDFDEAIESSGEEDELPVKDKSGSLLEEYWLKGKDRTKTRLQNRNRTPERSRDKEKEKRHRERYRERSRSRSRERRYIRKSPIRYKDENQRKDDRRRSPNRDKDSFKDRDRKLKERERDRNRDRDKHRERERSRERRHQSKSPPRKRRGK